MSEGIQLSLMIGPGVPVPVGSDVIDALESATVTTGTDGASGFQLAFRLDPSSPLATAFLLSGGALVPMVRVILIVTVLGVPNVLMDGVMTNHQVSGAGTDGMKLTVTGEDLSRVMDYIDFSGTPYPAMPIAGRVTLILAKYSVLGIVPMVIPSVLVDLPNPIERIPSQQGKDLPYLLALAEEVGYVFYVEPGPVAGVSTAYFGPEIKIGVPQPALNVDMDAETSVESISFEFDSESTTLPYVLIQNQYTKVPIPIPIPDVTPLSPPLGLVPPIPKNFEQINETAKYGAVRSALIGLAKAARSNEAVKASGSLDVIRYGHVLKARQLVGLRGVGTAFNGLYYVRSVTHNIRRGEYTQDFVLSRNGLVSTTSTVSA